MAKIRYKNEIKRKYDIPENLIRQGDFIFCDANNTGALSFWGIYSNDCVVALDGGGDSYLPKKQQLYLDNTYNHWTITKRIKNDNIIITIEELY